MSASSASAAVEVWTCCLDCGAPSPLTRCADCKRPRHSEPTRPSPSRRGYDRAWRRLVRRAINRQDFCSDCNSPYDLTGDHSPEAWRRHDRGERITLDLIDVVCSRCNSARGRARGGGDLSRHPLWTPRGEGSMQGSATGGVTADVLLTSALTAEDEPW